MTLAAVLVCIGTEAQDSVYARRVICDMASDEMYGRGMQHRGDSIAADYVRRELAANGVKPLGKDYYQEFIFPQSRSSMPIIKVGYRSKNVCGYIPGQTDSMIVFTAHYDHVGMHGDTLFPGAHDNASGVAAVLDLARRFNQQRGYYTYVFLFFGGEEAGLVGSRHFVEQPLINLPWVKLLINIDLFCGGDDGLMVVNSYDRSTTGYVDLLQQINEQRDYAATVKRRDNAPNSDHWFFSQECPSIFIYTLGGRYGGYHSPDDTCEGCGLEHYEDFLSLLYTFIQHLEP